MTGVVITGTAAIGPHGMDPNAHAAAFRAGSPLAVEAPPCPLFGKRRRSTQHARVPQVDLEAWVPPRTARRMSTSSKWAVAAGRAALADAGINDGGELAVALATCFGPGNFTKQLLQQVLQDGPKSASPFLFTDCVANAPCGQLAIAVGAKGANATISQREAGPALSVFHGVRELTAGRARAVLVGTVDEIEDVQEVILDRMGALAPTAADARPFDRGRAGFLLGEGATVLVLERDTDAVRRGAEIRARVAGVARGFDPTARPANWGQGARALAASFRSGIDPDGIDVVVSGASGSRAGDRLEGAVLRELFGGDLPPVLTPKAVFGEYSGGGILPGLLALAGGEFISPAVDPDPEIGITPFSGTLNRVRRVLVTALGSGGAAGWVVLEQP